MNGFLLVDKESGMTSHDVVARVRRRFSMKKVGHAGTLDPMATGVLVLGIGNATRLLQYVVDGVKGYSATIVLGASTITDDAEGEILKTATPEEIAMATEERIKGVLASMVGTIHQRPSSVSAIKVAGKTGHERVRAGEEFELPTREVTITTIDVHSITRKVQSIEVEVSVLCSAGTYIRAIARDLGDALGIGGHLNRLHRTLVSPFAIAECSPWESAEPITTAAGISRILPTRSLRLDELVEISFGRHVGANAGQGIFVGVDGEGEFASLLENYEVGGQIFAKPSLVSVKE